MLYTVLAYLIWGSFAAFFPLLKPAAPLEILAHRVVWTAVFMLILIVATKAIRELRALDVVALGPDIATALGVDHRRISRRVMVMVAVLVSVSTALVGPIMFLGLLVAHLAYWAAGTNRHVVTVPMAALVAMLVLVTGQTVLAHVLDADNVLSVIIEFLGGLTLIALLISSRRRS